MDSIADYLYSDAAITFFFCVTFGYLFSRIKAPSFTVDTVIRSLVAGLLIELCVSQLQMAEPEPPAPTGPLSVIADYLHGNLTVTIFLCLTLGYLLGKIKIGSFTVGATAGSLIAGLAVGLFIYQFTTAKAGGKLIDGPLSSLFFALFCFAIGFEVGPAFFSSLKATGLKIMVLSVFFSAVGLVTVYILTKALGLDAGIGAGLIAGALTQSAVLGVVGKGMETNAQICYALTYVFGMIGVILFAKRIAPMILGKDLRSIAK